jgi:uncharacterized repeat protein (TIGR03803 family)
MKSKTSWAAASAHLAVVAVTLIAVLTLAPDARAAKFKTLYRFTGGADGAYPADVPALILDQAGNLYGTAIGGGNPECSDWNGCGVVFKLTPNQSGTWSETVLYSFVGGNDASNPQGSVIFDAAGTFYGTTLEGGPSNAGTVFQLAPNLDGTWTETVLYSFAGGTDGTGPAAGLIFDGAGNLYSTTYLGGHYGCGTAFELMPNGNGTWTEKVLHSFTCGKDGAQPQGTLIFDSVGNLYGTTNAGGKGNCYINAPGCGVVFKLVPNSDGTWTEKVLYRFSGGKDGADPSVAAVMFDQAGNIYGTAGMGGAYGGGVAFELIPKPDGTWKEKVLHQFTGGKDGHYPFSGLISDAAGNLYGTTWDGGAHNLGTVYELMLGQDGKWREKVLHSFASNPGAILTAGLVFDATGNLYGAARNIYFGPGSVFEITP